MRMKMKRVFRRNQIIITTLAIMIAAAGYLNYAGKSDLPGADTYEAGATKISDSDIYSENQAVSGSVADGEYEEIASLDDPGEGDPLAAGSEEGIAQGAADGDEASADNPAVDNPGEAVLTGGTGVAEYIANVQLSREQIRAKNREALNALINNENLDASAKEAAVQDMLALNAIAEKENAAETLLMAKGFADPVVSITDGKVDVVVNAPSITDPQRAQIEDIVKRKTEISAENIVISLLNLGEDKWLLFTGRHFWNRKCRKKTWWQQEFAVLKCEATANSVTGHVCVNSNSDEIRTGNAFANSCIFGIIKTLN